MKKFLLITLSICAMEASFAQTASDYYMSFCVGNQTVLYTPDNIGGWSGRITTYTLIKTDSISGELYYVEEGIEYDFDNPNVPSPFHYLWLRKDVNGEILLKAMSGQYPILDSAQILPTPMIYFSNNIFTTGYSYTLTNGSQTETDSIISTHASFDIFNNCIQKRATKRTSGVIDWIGDTYYASGVGYIGGNRSYPANEVHTDEFASAFVTGCAPIVDSLPAHVVDTCLGQYLDYYVSNIQVDTLNDSVTVTWVFQDSVYTNQFVQGYNYLYPGNNVISITLQCSKSTSTTYYGTINISSSGVGIREFAGTKPVINIYPNPASDHIMLSTDRNDNTGFTMYIYNVMGSLVKTCTLQQNQQQINIGDLSDGIYMVVVRSDHNTQKQKLIIQR